MPKLLSEISVAHSVHDWTKCNCYECKWFSEDEVQELHNVQELRFKKEFNLKLEQLRIELVEHEDGILTYNTANYVNNVFARFRGLK